MLLGCGARARCLPHRGRRLSGREQYQSRGHREASVTALHPIEIYQNAQVQLRQTLAQNGSTRTGPFHGLHQNPVHAEGPPHYETKAEIEPTALLQAG